ncbi:hypothetical protein CR513_11561, partial [Mucuna pruriens]
MRYFPVERTCCTLAWAAWRLRAYMLSHTTWLISKTDPFKYIFEKPSLIGKIARWQVALFEYDIVHVMQKAIKGSVLADYLAHNPLADYQPMKHDFPNKYIFSLTNGIEQRKGWTLLFDGASNALGYNIEAVLISPQGVEYEAYAMGITMALEYQVKYLEVYGDSTLLCGEWETRDVKLTPYYSYIKELKKRFESVTFHHTP